MATYKEIRDYVKGKYGFTVKDCWIAHCKELNGFQTRPAPNRRGKKRLVPCPPAKRLAIEEAFRRLGMTS
jgi:hypothetical protein